MCDQYEAKDSITTTPEIVRQDSFSEKIAESLADLEQYASTDADTSNVTDMRPKPTLEIDNLLQELEIDSKEDTSRLANLSADWYNSLIC